MKRKIRRARGKATTESRVQETTSVSCDAVNSVTIVDVETGQRFEAERTGDFVAYPVEVPNAAAVDRNKRRATPSQ